MPTIDFDGRRAWLDEFLRAPTHETLVAHGPAGPVGFLTTEGGYLHQLVVAREAQGSGVAVALLHRAQAGSPEGLALDVNQTNGRAVRFYAREGFSIEAEGVNPLSGLPTWRMTWRPAGQTSP